MDLRGTRLSTLHNVTQSEFGQCGSKALDLNHYHLLLLTVLQRTLKERPWASLPEMPSSMKTEIRTWLKTATQERCGETGLLMLESSK